MEKRLMRRKEAQWRPRQGKRLENRFRRERVPDSIKQATTPTVKREANPKYAGARKKGTKVAQPKES